MKIKSDIDIMGRCKTPCPLLKDREFIPGIGSHSCRHCNYFVSLKDTISEDDIFNFKYVECNYPEIQKNVFKREIM